MLLKNKADLAKRLLLEKSCKNCFVYRSVFATAKTISTPKFMPLSNAQNRKDFLTVIYGKLPERGCGLKISFEGKSDVPTVECPEEGYCDGWLDPKADFEPLK
jgi:hypothetical protein